MIKSIIDDDIELFEKDFAPLLKKGSVFLGAYSLLSVLYIYNAKNILYTYEYYLTQHYNDKKILLDENNKIDERFSLIAKANYRLYLKAKEISPVEVLILQEKYKKAIRLSNDINLKIKQQERLKNILEKNDKIKNYNITSTIEYTELFYDNKNKKKEKRRLVVIAAFMTYIIIALSTIFAISDNYNIYVDDVCISSYRLFNNIKYSVIENDIDEYKNKNEIGENTIILGPYIDKECSVLYDKTMTKVKNFYFRKKEKEITCVVYEYVKSSLITTYNRTSTSLSEFKKTLEDEYKVFELQWNGGYWAVRTHIYGPYEDSEFIFEYNGGSIAYFKVVSEW